MGGCLNQSIKCKAVGSLFLYRVGGVPCSFHIAKRSGTHSATAVGRGRRPVWRAARATTCGCSLIKHGRRPRPKADAARSARHNLWLYVQPISLCGPLFEGVLFYKYCITYNVVFSTCHVVIVIECILP